MWKGPAGCGHKLAGAHQQQGRLSVCMHPSFHLMPYSLGCGASCFQCACVTTSLSVCMHHEIAFSVHASQHCVMGIRISMNQSFNQSIYISCLENSSGESAVQVTLPQDMLCMCVLCFAWRRLRQVFCPQYGCQKSPAYERKCRSQNMLDKHIITTNAAAFLPNVASAALALTSDTPLLACMV